jgi:transcriptional regulator with XRE-family HTH domain
MGDRKANGQKLKQWRERQVPKLSQQKAAEMIGTFQGTWAPWEKGTRGPDVHHALEIEKLTDGEVPASGWAKLRDRKTPRGKKRARPIRSAAEAA